jgi:hypothetical protein
MIGIRSVQDELLPDMMRWLGAWDIQKQYYHKDCVIGPDNTVYISLTDSTNKDPRTEPSYWQPAAHLSDIESRVTSLEQNSSIHYLTTTLQEVQYENKSLRTELSLLKSTLLEILDTLTQGVRESLKGGPSEWNSSVQ